MALLASHAAGAKDASAACTGLMLHTGWPSVAYLESRVLPVFLVMPWNVLGLALHLQLKPHL